MDWNFIWSIARHPLFTGPVGALIGFYLGRISERSSLRRKAKAEFLDVLHEIMLDIAKGPSHPRDSWDRYKMQVDKAVFKLIRNLPRYRRQRFSHAWDKCRKITDADLFPNNQPGFVSKGQDQDKRDAASKIIEPLCELITIAEGA